MLRLAASRKLNRIIRRRYLFSEIDFEMQIIAVLQTLESNVKFEHIEGHQDTTYPNQPLSWAAQLNMRCDEIATNQLEAASQPIPNVTFLPVSQVSISVGNHTITHHIPTQLRYFSGLHGWTSPTIFDLIDWPLFHQATLATTFAHRLFIITWINGLLPYKQSPTAHCPSACGCDEEDGRHFS
jgi:hypothetical protein